MPHNIWSRGGILLLLCAALILSTDLGHTAHATSAQPAQPLQTIPRGDPIGIVYYRCELRAGRCNRTGALFFVHNGIALQSASSGAPFVRIGHVADWNKPQETLDICGEDLAATVAAIGPTHVVNRNSICHGSSEPDYGDPVWRPWARVRTMAYPPSMRGDPMAFMVNNDTRHPHNGAFQDFVFLKSNGSPDENTRTTNLDTAITMANAPQNSSRAGTLRYYHAVNHTGTPSNRVSYDPYDFRIEAAAVTGRIRIRRLHT